MFYIDNISSKDMNILAEHEDFLQRAGIDYDEIDVEGKNGSEFFEKNYMSVESETTIYALSDNLDYLYPLFTGKHKLRVDDRETTVYFFDMLETFLYSARNAFSVNFIRDPFWYKYNDDFVKVTSTVTNDGNVDALPIIKLIGVANTDLDITIAGIRFTYHFDNDTEVVIDCDKQTETSNGISKSKNIEIGFQYPKLSVGSNDITIHSGECEIYMMRKDVYL